MSDRPPRSDGAAYMRWYRQQKGGLAPGDRAYSKACNLCAVWVRRNIPELWDRFMVEAWAEINGSAS